MIKRIVRCISSSFALPESHTWERTYTATSTRELMEAYKDWAPTYDQDSITRFGYAAPSVSAEVVAKHSPDPISLWLDAGCGTGQVGQHLNETHRFQNVIGADLSPDMLKEAEAKHVYRSLHEVDLSDPLSFSDNSFDGIVSVGTLTPNHLVEGKILETWIRWLKPGGLVVLSLRDDFWEAPVPGKHSIQEISQILPWTLIETTEPQLYTPLVDDRIMFRVRVWKI